MFDFMVIVNVGDDFSFPIKVKAIGNTEATIKACVYCEKEGYEILSTTCVRIDKNVGIVDLG